MGSTERWGHIKSLGHQWLPQFWARYTAFWGMAFTQWLRKTVVVFCWLILCQLDINTSHFGREDHNWENIPTQLACGQARGAFSWLAVDARVAQSSVSVATPGLVVLGAIRKQSEQPIGIKPVNSIPSWLLDQFLFGVLPWVPSVIACYPEVWYKPFHPQLLSVTVFHLSLRKGKCGCVWKVNYQKALFSLYSFSWCDYGYMEVNVIKLHAALFHTHIHMSSVCIMSYHKKRQCKRTHVGSPYKSFKVCI